MALEELGPTFVKLGQILSTRADLVGRTLAEELRKLQDHVPADPPEAIHRIVEDELGQPIKDLFLEFDDAPLASASIGQVHRARLKNGEAVVVKVQHDGVQETIRKDLEVLSGLAPSAGTSPGIRPLPPRRNDRGIPTNATTRIGFWPRGTESAAVFHTIRTQSVSFACRSHSRN